MSDEMNDPFAWAGAPDDDLAQVLAHDGHRWTNRLTGVLAILIVFVGGAAAGSWNAGRSSAAAATGSFAQFASLRSQFQALRSDSATVGAGSLGVDASGGAASGVGTFAGGSIRGTVILIDAAHHKIYVRGSDGTTTAISTSPATTALARTPLDLAALRTGTTVSIDGTTGSDGTVAATSITLETKQ